MENNYGFINAKERSEQDGTEYLSGVLTCKAEEFEKLPFKEMKKYFPKGEVQRGAEDMQDCASRDKVNLLEAKYNWLYTHGKLTPKQINFALNNGYINNGHFEFSDAFIAILSDTTKQGNSLKAPLQAIRKYGLVPKKLLPLEKTMTWEEYHDEKRITPQILRLGERWLEIMGEISYGKEYNLDKNFCVVTAVHAWPSPVNGIYPRVDYPFNHAVYRPAPKHWVFDNYVDSVDGDFIKHLSPDFKFYEYGYRIAIGEPKKKTCWFIRWINSIME